MAEEERHEGTWLTWPRTYTYGKKYANEIEYIWIEIAKNLSEGEKVHIIAYNENLKKYIVEVLEKMM